MMDDKYHPRQFEDMVQDPTPTTTSMSHCRQTMSARWGGPNSDRCTPFFVNL
jgi:hypothetical protein